jgi:hypothetical protein
MAEKFPTIQLKSPEKCFNLTIKGQDLKRFTNARAKIERTP